jgi:hypothetical protein
MADKRSGPATDSIMSPAEMKPLLMMSKREPVNAVIGMTKDHEGIILLSKRIKPKKLLAQLKADARKSKIELDVTSLRFGKAEVDADKDSGLVMFTVNKDAPSALRMKLLELVKRVPYAKVEIDVDAKIEDEPARRRLRHRRPRTRPPQTSQSGTPHRRSFSATARPGRGRSRTYRLERQTRLVRFRSPSATMTLHVRRSYRL